MYKIVINSKRIKNFTFIGLALKHNTCQNRTEYQLFCPYDQEVTPSVQ